MGRDSMNTNILNEIRNVLNGIERYWIDEKLAKQMVIEDLRNNDSNLISKLLSNQIINETYVQDIDGYKIFDKEAFISMLRYKNYWQDSYTKYANKIGLTSDGKYLNYNSDIVLDFPFKDCVLEGGMTKEDSILKNDEKFYNQIIAKNEIDALLAPKVLKNIKKINKDGIYTNIKIKDDDNLIIKGNNLITLHSIKNKYKSKVKMVYIDPPYNTQSSANTFYYNNRFNHSSWLTFMKNRIEISKEILSNDGIFVVAIDDNELFYLGVLLDEIFRPENKLGVISVVHNPGGRQDEQFFPTAHENMLIYAKDIEKVTLNNLPISDEKIKQFNKKDKYGRYKTRNFRRSGNNSRMEDRPKLYYPIYFNQKTGNLQLEENEGSIKLLPIDSNGIKRCWRWSKETFLKRKDKYIEIVNNNKKFDLFVKERESDYEGEKPKTIWNKSQYTGQTATYHLKNLFKDKVFSYPKSEFLMKDIIAICSNPKDLILDFFMGSATTQSVAHKMNRQYIGIEQMNYINTVSVPRLQKVIAGEQGGISKDVDWQGGGSFIYAELAKENQEIVDKIISSNTKEELSQQINNLLDNGVLNYEVDFNEFTNTKKEFNELKLEDQKEVLIRVLDSNQLYVNYSDIEDTAYNFTEDEIAFNHSFYGGE